MDTITIAVTPEDCDEAVGNQLLVLESLVGETRETWINGDRKAVGEMLVEAEALLTLATENAYARLDHDELAAETRDEDTGEIIDRIFPDAEPDCIPFDD